MQTIYNLFIYVISPGVSLILILLVVRNLINGTSS